MYVLSVSSFMHCRYLKQIVFPPTQRLIRSGFSLLKHKEQYGLVERVRHENCIYPKNVCVSADGYMGQYLLRNETELGQRKVIFETNH